MKKAIVINSDTFGKGDEELGKRLLGAFLRKLWVSDEKPEHILLYNGGAKLVSKSSMLLEVLHGLEESGVEILACGTCLQHYGLKDQIDVGRMTDMEEIVSIMMTADSVITV